MTEPIEGSFFTLSRYHSYIAIMTTVQAITTAIIMLRLYVRIKITRSFGLDDIVLIIAHLLNVTATAIWLEMRRQAIYVVPDSQEAYDKFSAITLVAVSLYIAAGVFAKMAIAHWFVYVARTIQINRALILVPLGVYLTVCTVCWCLGIFRCGAIINAVRIVNNEDCMVSPSIMHYAGLLVSVFNSVCDWIFAAVPLYMVIKMKNMSKAHRIATCILIFLAISGSIISIARIPFLDSNSTFGPKFLSNPAMVTLFILSVVETAVAIATISLATLKPLLPMLRRCLYRSSRQSAVHDEPKLPGFFKGGEPSDELNDTRSASVVAREMLASWETTYAQRTTTTQGTTHAQSMHIDTMALSGIGVLKDIGNVNEIDLEGWHNDSVVSGGKKGLTAIISTSEVTWPGSK